MSFDLSIADEAEIQVGKHSRFEESNLTLEKSIAYERTYIEGYVPVPSG